MNLTTGLWRTAATRLFISLIIGWPAAAAARPSLDALIHAALERDAVLAAATRRETAFTLQGEIAEALPDPVLSASLANLPTDTFSFSQEPMTQFRVGIMQAFPSAVARSRERERFEARAETSAAERRTRAAELALAVHLELLKTCRARQTIALIETDRPLFEQLVAVTGAGFSTATARTNQQDVVRARLELAHLDERVLKLEDAEAQALEQLGEWVPRSMLTDGLDCNLPEPGPAPADVDLMTHPKVEMLEREVAVARADVARAEADERPGWRLDAGYAIRDEDRTGRRLPDFVSVGVSVELPMLRASRIDRSVQAAANRVEAAQSIRLNALRQLESRLARTRATLANVDEQLALYRRTLIGEHELLAEAALNAYTNDTGDFADVARAYIALLGIRIEALRLDINRREALATLEYLASGDAS